ncbi:MAG TPA: T9SS type A sorting domain-containing protein, partial [Flavobacteriales bacterium]
NDATTENDTVNDQCVCVGTPIVIYDCPVLEANIGDDCNDNDATTENDTVNDQCVCVGTPIVIYDCPVLEANIGDACNDNDATTENDTINDQCVCAGTPIVIYDCPVLEANIGDACNDGNAGTTDDTVNASCECVGVPTDCTENLVLALTLDASAAETTWELRDSQGTLVVSGGPYQSGQTSVEEELCVPQGCYSLRVNDAGANGISEGGYVLRYVDGRRIIDAATGDFTSTSQVLHGGLPMPFCVPLGNSNMLAGTCDKPSRRISAPVYASSFGPSATQYQFWIFDPHGTYSRRVAYPVPQFTPANLATNPVPVNTELNVCVRVMVNGAYRPFGPVCRYFFTPNPVTIGGPNSLVEGGIAITLYPNPNRTGIVNLHLEGVDSEAPVQVEVMDAMGRSAHSQWISATDGTTDHVLELQDKLRAGMYLVGITIDGQRYTQRLVLE